MKKNHLIIYIIFVFIACLSTIIQEWGFNFNFIKGAFSNANANDMFYILTFANGRIFMLTCPLLIMFLSTNNFHKIYHSGMLSQFCERENYEKYMKNKIIKIYLSNSFVYSFYILLMLILCFTLFKGTKIHMNMPLDIGTFAFVSVINSILLSIFIINIALITTRYTKKNAIKLIVSYLTFIAYAIVSEVLIGGLMEQVIPGSMNSFSVFNLVVLDGNIYITVTYAIIITIISTLIVYLSYKNKEKVLNDY